MTNDQKRDKTSESDPGAETGETPVQKVIQAFGGIRPMATKLGIAVSTVQGWKNRGAIPDSRHGDILDAAKTHGVTLDPDLLKASGDGGEADADAAKTPESAEEPEDAEVVAEEYASAGGAKETAAAGAGASAGAGAATAGEGRTDSAEAAEKGRDEEELPPPPRVIERPRATGWVPGLLLGAAVLVIGAGSAVVLREHWLPLIGRGEVSGPVADRMADLDRRLNALSGQLDGQVARLSERISETAAPEGLDELNTTVNDLAAEVADIEDRIAAGEAGDGAVSAASAEALEELSTVQERLAGRLDTATTRLDEVAGRFDTVSNRLETVGQRLDTLAETRAGTEQLAALRDQVATLRETLDGRVSALQEDFEALASVADLQKTRDAAAKAARDAAARELGAAMAVVQLSDALRDSAPYDATLAATRARLPQEPAVQGALETLAAHAQSGVPTRLALQERFTALAGEAVAVSAGDGEKGLMTGVLRRLGDVVQVRPVGEQTGKGAGATLARAEARLTARDLAGAVAEVEALSGAPAETMAPWLADAKARLAADRAVNRLREAVIAPGSGADANGDADGDGA